MPRPPKSFHGYWGQRAAVRIIRRHVRGSLAMGLPIEPTLLTGSSGLGKTELAKAIGQEAKATVNELVVDRRRRDNGIEALLEGLRAGDIQFLDEVQDSTREDQMALCRWIDAAQAKISASRGQPGQNKDLPGTLICATDRPGLLLSPLLKRFSLVIELQPYSTQEMELIARKRAAEKSILLSNQARNLLARTCRGLPRLCGQRLELLMRNFAIEGVNRIASGHVRKFLHLHGIDDLGLTALDRSYLQVLAKSGGAGATLKTLEKALDTDGRYLDRQVEPYLVRLGFLQIGQVRTITAEGLTYKGAGNDSNG